MALEVGIVGLPTSGKTTLFSVLTRTGGGEFGKENVGMSAIPDDRLDRLAELVGARKVTRAAAAIKLGLQDELVLGDLGAVRDWSHARDIVRGYQLMLAQDEPGDYVLASGVGRTVGDLVAAAFAVVELDPEQYVHVDERLVRPPEPMPPVGDATLARERLGWEPETSFAALIEERLFEPDIARSSPGEPLSGTHESFEGWFWNKLSHLL